MRNIEVIDLSIEGENRIEGLKVEDVFGMTYGRNELTIFGDSDDSVSLAGGWTDNGGGTYTGTHNGNTVTLEVQGAGVIID